MAGGLRAPTVITAQNTSQAGEPTYYLPGTRVPDPNYATKKQQYDQQQAAERARNDAIDRERTNFHSAANNNANYAVDFTDPRTGLNMSYPGSGGGSSNRGAGTPTGTMPPAQTPAPLSIKTLLDDTDKVLGPAPAPVAGPVPAPTRADRTASNDAAFARAKDRVGMSNRASLNALRGMMTERGIEGSGIEGAGIASILNAGEAQLGDTTREQATADLAREQAVEDRDYQGNITQRGQDIGQRGQDISMRDQRRAALEALFRMKGGGLEATPRLY